MLLYITSNQNKTVTANRLLSPFGITVEGYKVEGIIEPQIEDIVEISKYKAKQAYEIVKKPLIVSDGGWMIPALNGFPGPYMAYVNSCFTPEDFLNLMKDKKDQTIILKECVTYIDENQTKSFVYETKGHFLKEKHGQATSVDQVITFREDLKTTAECINEGISGIPQNNLWNEVGEWIKENI